MDDLGVPPHSRKPPCAQRTRSAHLSICLSVWLAGCLAGWLSGCLAVWLSGCLAAWLPGCLAVWLSGCLAAWLSGCLAGWLSDKYIDSQRMSKIQTRGHLEAIRGLFEAQNSVA